VWIAQLALAACAAASGTSERPALLVAPDAQVRAELSQAVASAFDGAPVALADDALTKDSALVIDRTPARDASGKLLSGRDLGKPEHFHLVAIGTRCLLVHDRSGRRFELTTATCTAAP
jgi:hypothetical protein